MNDAMFEENPSPFIMFGSKKKKMPREELDRIEHLKARLFLR